MLQKQNYLIFFLFILFEIRIPDFIYRFKFIILIIMNVYLVEFIKMKHPLVMLSIQRFKIKS